MSDPNTRLFEEYKQTTPTEPISLTSVGSSAAAAIDAVTNFYGRGSKEQRMAQEYFSGANANDATMIFARENQNQRDHVIGANLIKMSMDQLRSVVGSPLEFQFDGYDYAASVDLAAATSFANAAQLLTSALDPTAVQAQLTNSTVTPETISFIGTVNPSWDVNEISGPQLVVGGRIFAPGENLNGDAAANQVILSHGGGRYTTESGFDHITTPTPMTETYSILHVGSVSGNFQIGQKLVGPNKDVPPLTAVIAEIAPGEYLLNNSLTASGNFHTTAPPLYFRDNTVVGATENRNYFSVQPNGNFGFDSTPSSLSYGSGAAADALGLSQAAGALISPLGGQNITWAQNMNYALAATGGAFSSFQDEGNRVSPSEQWAAKHGVAYLSNSWSTTPAGTL